MKFLLINQKYKAMKTFLDIRVTRKDGSFFENPLKLSEAHFISKLAQQNEMVQVCAVTVSDQQFKSIFG